MAIFMKQRLPAWVSWENAWDWLSYRKKTWEDPVDVQELRSGISFLSGKSKEQNLKRSATKPQPKPLTAETAEGAEIRRKSKGRD